MELHYTHDGEQKKYAPGIHYAISCVDDRKEVLSSLDKDTWSRQVIREEYSKLKGKVASAIREGKKQEALDSIMEYEQKNREMNRSVDSAEVAHNLDEEVQSLKESVEDTFAGAPSAVMMKQKQQSKSLQYESYRVRRDKK